MTNNVYEYCPDYAIHPGDYIYEYIEATGLKQNELALRLGITPKHLNNIIKGKVPVTTETAKALQHVFNTPATYWLSLQTAYNIFMHDMEKQKKYEANKEEYDKWFGLFDYDNFVRLKYFDEIYGNNNIINKIENLLHFFSCSDISSWNNMYNSELPAACRIFCASHAKLGNTVAWIRKGQIISQQIINDIPDYNKEIFKTSLCEIRKLSLNTENTEDGFDDKMISYCKKAGVCLIFVPEISGSGFCGAAFWINNGAVPCIQMSLRLKTNDHLWFTFFNEASHILKGHKKAIYLDCDMVKSNSIEAEANKNA